MKIRVLCCMALVIAVQIFYAIGMITDDRELDIGDCGGSGGKY